jgi:hypothetical protein
VELIFGKVRLTLDDMTDDGLPTEWFDNESQRVAMEICHSYVNAQKMSMSFVEINEVVNYQRINSLACRRT